MISQTFVVDVVVSLLSAVRPDDRVKKAQFLTTVAHTGATIAFGERVAF